MATKIKLKIKTGDFVKVLAGKDKGKTGKVIQVFPKKQRVVVDGVNMMKKHLRSQQKDQPGQRVELAAPLHISNVKKVDADATPKKKVATKKTEDKK